VAVRDILFDTNAYSAFKRNSPEAVEIIQHAQMIGINSIVLGELLAGFGVGKREALNRQELNMFLSSKRVKRLAVDEGTSEYYSMIYRKLRQQGQPIPTNDMWIAATALQHGFAVFTYDGHFQHVDGLQIGNHLADFIF
jgi:tRNA(fMet)-specific endonuclease VapC